MSVNEATQGMLQIAGESPLTAEAAALFALSDAYAAALYPAESNHMVDAELLAQPYVIFCVARREGKALGCGAAVLYGGPEAPYAEIKRMFVHEEARGSWVGDAHPAVPGSGDGSPGRAHAAPRNGGALASRPSTI